MGRRGLTQRGLNRALLARQLLLERSRLPLVRVLEQVGGLQAQYAPSAYLGLWARVDGFRREDLTRALERGRAVQATLMRVTIHVVSARDFRWFAEAIRDDLWTWSLRARRAELAGVDVEAAADRVRALLAHGPMRAPDLVARMEADGFPRAATATAMARLEVVRVPPSGTWERRRADLYGLADHLVASVPLPADRQEALDHLVRRYVRAFGPATAASLADWAGVTLTAVRPALERLRLRRFVDEEGRELLDVPGAPLPDPDTPAPVRFLGTWEALLLVHARASQVLPERFRDRIFHTKAPQSFPTFLVDGAVAGTWRYEGGRVRVEPFEPLPRAARRAVDEEASLLAAWHRA